MKKILFITCKDTIQSDFRNEIRILGSNYNCIVTSALTEAHTIVNLGVDRVIMYPFYITHKGYKLSSDKNPIIFAAYWFWKQEVAEKGISTIVIDFQMQPAAFMREVKRKDWETDPNVKFFEHNNKLDTARELVKLIDI